MASDADLPPHSPPPTLEGLGPVGFVGAGALATALAPALAARSAAVVAVTARHPERAERLAGALPGCRAVPDAAAVADLAGIVFLAVPDDALPTLDAGVVWRAGQAVVHLSGAHGRDALPRAASGGAHVAALHPLMLFPRGAAPDAADALARLAGCTWALEAGDEALTAALATLVAALEGRVVRLRSTDRVPYHLAAVLASNYVVALLGAAVAIWQDFGVASPDALEALLPLLRGSVEQIARLGPVASLTGPIARGDAGTVAAHLAWLRRQIGAGGTDPVDRSAATPAGPGAPPPSVDPAALFAAYCALARLALPLAEARGTLSPTASAALRTLLEDTSGAS
jgi:predicted short-subunit dehydrogenase-like oxidoreductase (DUF2520 family)